jgi:hypothetical protein
MFAGADIIFQCRVQGVWQNLQEAASENNMCNLYDPVLLLQQ